MTCDVLQGKGLMSTFWLTGETNSGQAVSSHKNYQLMNQDEGIDDEDIDEITFTFHVSEHQTDSQDT